MEITLDRLSGASLHRQLYERISAAIRDGRLPAGARLPSTRSLAVQLGVARGTVDAVYARLTGEGYLLPLGHRGTVVAPGSRPPTPTEAAEPAAAQRPVEPWLPLQLGLPAFDLFPRKAWTRLLARQARQLSSADMVSPDPTGLPALREAIAAYLAVSRGIACSAGQILVTHGYQDALGLVADLLLRPGDQVWCEDPGYAFGQRALRARGAVLVPVPVDEEGLCVGWARQRADKARLAVVTPAHQFPLGMTLSPPRRRDLLAWAAESDGWIVEDDYDCEFHYGGHKPMALKASDFAGRVLYIGSFSKSLLPSLRLGYLVLPPSLVESARQAQFLRHRGAGPFEQRAMADFMAQGHFARHLRRMRVCYKARRDALVAALKQRFGNDIDLALRAGGLHILARFPGAGNDVPLAARALEAGLKPSPLSPQYLEHAAGQGLLLCFTNVPETKTGAVADTLFRIARSPDTLAR